MLPKTSTYVKRFNGGNKWINILAKDHELLKKKLILGIKPIK